MQRYTLLSFWTLLLSFAMGMFTSCLQDEELVQSSIITNREQVALTIQSDRLLPQVVKSRASDTKNNAETDINYLYLFFFGQDGNYLANVTDRFESFKATSDLTVKIDKEAVQGVDNDEPVQVYVLANMHMYGLFDGEKDAYGRPILNGSGSSTDLKVLESKLLKINDLQSLKMQIPEGGMPMAKLQEIDFTDPDLEKGVPVALSALMARVDFNIQLQVDHSNGDYPTYYLEQYIVGNAPKGIHIHESASDATIVTEQGVGGKENVSVRNQKLIYNNNGEISFSFYMFQNIQYPKVAPSGVVYQETQKFKPVIAPDNAAYVDLKGIYTTEDEIQYYVTHRLYLGANHTNDFTIKSNYQYKNDIVIKGLTTHNNPNGGDKVDYFTLDTRVNIDEDSQFYISILNEKKLDAHFAVVPMDVYFLGQYKTSGSKMVVTLGDDTNSCFYDSDGDGDVELDPDEPWIRMEKVPAANMANCSLPTGMTENTHVKKSGSYQPYHGIRKFFTEDLVTSTLKNDGKSITIDASRDRIYFYVDENLGDSERTGTVTLQFYANGVISGSPTRTEVIEFKQLPLKEVNVIGEVNQTLWMEQIEEYLYSNDPLESYSVSNVFVRLKWGFEGVEIKKLQDLKADEPYNNYYNGREYTALLMSSYTDKAPSMGDLTLALKPECAAQYCYNRNKRIDTNGTVDDNPITYKAASWTNWTEKWEVNDKLTSKWFLPGITQMEDAIEQYYNTFPEFQNNFYWSSAAGKKTEVTSVLGITNKSQAKEYARATMSDGAGSYLGSEYKKPKDGEYAAQPGCIPRGDDNKEYNGINYDVRIRAFRMDRKKR